MAARLDPFLHPVFGDLFDAHPLVIYDIGAAGEVYCPVDGGPGRRVRIYGFEPVERSYEALIKKYADNPYVEVRQLALAETNGVVILYVLDQGLETNSSLLPRDGLDLHARPVEVESKRLDNVPNLVGFPPADFIKLDTEGSEARILDAGKEMLDRDVLGVVSEISFWRRDAGGAVFSDIDRLLTQAGFVLFDLTINRYHNSTIGGKKDKLRTGDALYLRDFAQLSERLVDVTIERRRIKLLKLVSLCVAWRYLNYALELVDYGQRHRLITRREFTLLSEAFASTTDIAQAISDFRGRAFAARFADAVSYVLHRDAKKAIPSTFNRLGNPWVVRRRGAVPRSVQIYKPVMCDGTSRRMKVIELAETGTDQ